MTGESVIDDGIRWDRLGRERFDELVEALLSRVHDGDGHVVEFPEGKGGDAGRDAVATVDGRTVVYQFKYYTDGLSTSGSNRASDVKKSFKRALEHSPDEWILVVPCKLTDPFRRLIRDLGKGSAVKVSCWDRPKLHSLLAAEPDLVALMKQDDLLTERARLLGHTALLLEGGLADAVAHRTATQSALSQMHPFWNVLMSEQSGVPTFTFVPKTKNAQELSPLGAHIELTSVGVEDPLGERLGEAVRFGRPGVIVIPQDRVAKFVPTGLEWAGISKDGPLPDWIEHHQPSVDAILGKPIALRAYDGSRQPAGAFPGTAIGGNRGTAGISIVVKFFGCVELALLFPQTGDAPGPGASVQVKQVLPGDPATTARALALSIALHTAAGFEVDIDDRRLARFSLNQSEETVDPDRLIAMHEVATDLARVQHDVGVFFDMPHEVTDLDRIWLRCARLMLDGHAALIPRASFSGAFTESPPPGFESPTQESVGAVVVDAGQSFNLFGQVLRLPMIRCYHPAARLTGGLAASAGARTASPQVRNFTLTATGNEAFLAFMPDRYMHEVVTPAPWNLTGVAEPESLPTSRPEPTHG